MSMICYWKVLGRLELWNPTQNQISGPLRSLANWALEGRSIAHCGFPPVCQHWSFFCLLVWVFWFTESDNGIDFNRWIYIDFDIWLACCTLKSSLLSLNCSRRYQIIHSTYYPGDENPHTDNFTQNNASTVLAYISLHICNLCNFLHCNMKQYYSFSCLNLN